MELNDKYAHLNKLSLAELVEEVGKLCGGYDWDGLFTRAGRDEFDYAKELLKSRIAEVEVERDGARAANRALILQRGELWAEVRTLKSYIAKLEADKSILRRRLETKNGRLIGERIAELEAKIVLLMGETERAKEE